MKYRKKPVVIDAELFEFDRWLYDRQSAYPMVECGEGREDGFGLHGIYPFIETLEGPHIVSDGDYIIQGVAGEYYPCKPDIFAQTYEPAE